MDGAAAPQPASSGSGVTDACSGTSALGRMDGDPSPAAAMEARFAGLCQVRARACACAGRRDWGFQYGFRNFSPSLDLSTQSSRCFFVRRSVLVTPCR